MHMYAYQCSVTEIGSEQQMGSHLAETKLQIVQEVKLISKSPSQLQSQASKSLQETIRSLMHLPRSASTSMSVCSFLMLQI